MSFFCSKCGSLLKKESVAIIHCYSFKPYASIREFTPLFLCPVCYSDFLSLNNFNSNKGDSKKCQN